MRQGATRKKHNKTQNRGRGQQEKNTIKHKIKAGDNKTTTI
jgi:hypothetical protein